MSVSFDGDLTEEALLERFPFQPNHLNANAPFDWGHGGTMYETFDEEYAYIRACPFDRVWTLIDDGDHLYVVNGRRFVNRLGYFVSTVAWQEDACYCVDLEVEMIEEGGP